MWDTCVNIHGDRLMLGTCGPGSRQWEYDSTAQRIKAQGRCLMGTHSGMTLQPCDDSDDAQTFWFTGEMNA